MKKGKLFIIVGPSGVGKGTLIKEILSKRNDFVLSVSKTTREKREGEIEGKNYYFVTKEEFQKEISEGNFLEYQEFFDNYYGTPKDSIVEILNKGTNIFLEIETMGAKDVLKNFSEAISIFISPPSSEELKNRLMRRKTESEEQIKMRLEKAEVEIGEKEVFKYEVVNDNVDDACNRIIKIIDSELEG